ncbi:MAG: hypothetical protein ACK55Z_01000 [bacterium]
MAAPLSWESTCAAAGVACSSARPQVVRVCACVRACVRACV